MLKTISRCLRITPIIVFSYGRTIAKAFKISPHGHEPKNALKILAHCHQLKIPVYRGADRPLKRDYVSAQDTHGNDGLGQSKLHIANENQNKSA